MDEWSRRRLRELEARVPVERKKTTEPFVKVPLCWIEKAAKATELPAIMLLIELLRLRWRIQSNTFPLPNGRLAKLGVSRKVKQRMLRQLELTGMISVDRRSRKTPVITIFL